jgi:hypothetical protein
MSGRRRTWRQKLVQSARPRGRRREADATWRVLANAQGWFYVVSGLWPLLHMRSFELVFGPKKDRWLVQTVAGLLVANGWTQVHAGTTGDGLAQAAQIGTGTALTLGAIDIRYAVPGRISRTYLIDAVVEAGWLAAWAATARPWPKSSGPLSVRNR